MATNEELITRARAVTDALAERVRKLSEGDPRWSSIIDDLEKIGTNPTTPFPDPTPEPSTTQSDAQPA